ncbi:MAG: histidinol-phosphatase [Spirochaetales bacterium]|nr:histidinol-phosphatase [Spirochaetales bacterium]
MNKDIRTLKNYHTHTYRCKHATGDIADYAEAALADGINVLGFTDHTPLPDNRWLSVRMHMDELEEYLSAITKAKPQYPGLTILSGLECDYFIEYHNFYKEELLGAWGLDYLIAGTHFFKVNGRFRGAHGGTMDRKELKAYTKACIKAIESGLFTFISHPDLFGMSCLEWDKEARAASQDILAAAAHNRVALEINSYGLRKKRVRSDQGERPVYPVQQFWELAADYDVKVVANSDAHTPEEVAGGIEYCQQLAADWGLTLADLSYLEK